MVGQGTTTYTVASIMERLYQTFLTPPDSQEAQVWLDANIDDSTTSIPLGAFAIPEDEALVRQGSIVEADQELFRVVSYTPTTSTIEVVRGEYGTLKVAHTIPCLMTLNPTYTRASVWEAVADNIALLHPNLFTTTQEYMPHLSEGVYPITDPLADDIVSIWPQGTMPNDNINVNGEIASYHPLTDGPAVICYEADGADIWVRFKRRMGRPELETDTLEALGVDPRWVNIVTAGSAGDLLVGRDIPETQTEWLKSVLAAENIRVGTRMSIAGGLRQYRNMLMDDFAKEIRIDNRKRIRIRDAIGQVQ